MGLSVFQVDAFANRAGEGNPAAVCILPEPADTDWMQLVAAEMNLSETAFLHRTPEAYDLRWFTPVREVDLCGHATLAAAHVLWETGRLAIGEEARFQTRSGRLAASREAGGIKLDFPATPVEPMAAPEIVAMVGADTVSIGRSRFDWVAEVDSEARLRGLEPDLAALGRLEERGMIVTAPAADGALDFVSRYFATAYGIDEDPVTGSAHCALAPFWSKKLGKQDFRARQISPRGGSLEVRLRGERVELVGSAVTVLVGELRF